MEPVRSNIIEIVFSLILSSTPVAESECLAQNIYYESRNQSPIGQMAVAEVTMNRVNSHKFPNNVCDVVYQPGAFSWTYYEDITTIPPIFPNTIEKDAWQKALVISKIYIAGMESDLTKNALYYHKTTISPYWSNYFSETVTIGDHVFYSD